MITKKLSIVLGYECNNNCRFCYCADKKYDKKIKPKSTENAKRDLERGVERGSDFVDFLGGEPTIRKDIFELIAYAKKLGYRTISITTNGRMLSYPDFAEKIVKAGLNSVIFSIHGHNAELHDYLTRSPGSFEQLIKGMKNVRNVKKDIYICTNTVIIRPNYMYLPQIAENNIKLGADACEFIFIHPRGNAYKNFEEIVPTLKEASENLAETIAIGKKHKIQHFVMRYFPMCYMIPIGSKSYLSEYAAIGKLKEEHVGPEFEDFNVEENRKNYGRVKGRQCVACKYEKECEGVFKEYAEKRGTDDLIPFA